VPRPGPSRAGAAVKPLSDYTRIPSNQAGPEAGAFLSSQDIL